MRGLSAVLVVLSAIPPAPVEAGGQSASELTIRSAAVVAGQTVTFTDVLSFTHADPSLQTAIEHEVLVADLPPAGTTVITHQQIEDQLGQLGVNLARVLLRGAASCRVTVASPGDQPTSESPHRLLRSRPESGRSAEKTLAEVLRALISDDLAGLGGTPEIEFERASRPLLDLSTPRWEFSIQPRGREKLGMREFRVVIRRDGVTHRTVDVFARVMLSKPVLVARRPLNLGTSVQPDDVGLEPRLFEQEHEIGCDRIEQVLGQQVKSFVPVGQMVRPDDLKQVDLVQRSRPVAVVGASQSVQVRMTGVALDSGRYGDPIRVRLGDTRKNRRVLHGVVAGLATVRIQEEYR
jgi:flagella basal body P-ring formation protein FlgA